MNRPQLAAIPRPPQKPWDKQHAPPPTERDIRAIRGWMTFEFLAERFTIPADYFRTTYNISDVKYPRITIEAVAKRNGLAPNVFVQTIKNDITVYLSQERIQAP